MKYYLAIDLGASSGRHVIGFCKNGQIVLDEIYRFKTGLSDSKYGKVWDLNLFFKEIIKGINLSFKKYGKIESLSIDTWGVDYVLMNGNKEILPYYSYRNNKNIDSVKKVHSRIRLEDLYKCTGIQFATFNTIYQLYDDFEKNRLNDTTDYLMLPNYFSYKLTGIKTHEYTNESTTSLINAKTKNYDFSIIAKIGLPKKIFTKIDKPGKLVGKLLPEIAKEVGGQTNVVLCASHDTASAFESVNCPQNSIIISSGTWSLIGIKTDKPIITGDSMKANFTNEGGVGYYRFLKNIMGMWIINQICEQEGLSYIEINKNLSKTNYNETFDVNAPTLVAPSNMKTAIFDLLKNNPPINNLDLFNSIYHSMAKFYKQTCDELEKITKKHFDYIYIIGGGAKNNYLNNLVEKYTNKKIVALPIEATSLGNIKIQMKIGEEK